MEEETKNKKKKLSAFQIVSIILIAILFVVIVVQISIIVNSKNKTDDLKEKNDKIPTVEESINLNPENYQFFDCFEDFKG